jgi:WD40 repeat protein
MFDLHFIQGDLPRLLRRRVAKAPGPASFLFPKGSNAMRYVLCLLIVTAIWPPFSIAQTTGASIRTYSGHTDKVTGVAISPDGRHILSGSDDKTIRLWDFESGTPVQVLREHQNYVLSVAFSRDGKRFLSAGGGQWRGPEFATESDQIVRLWDAADSKVVRKMTGHQAPVWSVAFSPDERFALSGSGGYEFRGGSPFPAGQALKLWNLASGEQVRDYSGHDNWVRSVAFHPLGKTLYSASWDMTVRVWDVEKIEAVQVLRDHKDHLNAVAISPDGKWLLSGGGAPGTAGGDTTIRLWDLSTGQVARRFAGHTARVWDLAFSNDGRHFLSAAADRTVRYWNVDTGEEVHRFVGHTDEVRQAVFTPDGKHVVSASHDRTLRLWRLP